MRVYRDRSWMVGVWFALIVLAAACAPRAQQSPETAQGPQAAAARSGEKSVPRSAPSTDADKPAAGFGAQSPVGQPAATGELRFAVASLGAQTLDPILEPTGAKTWLVAIYDHLVGMDATGSKLDPNTGLASKWESSPDQQTWTFTLREGVKFHNGDPVTSEDVKFSLERTLGDKSVAGYVASLRKKIGSVEAPDPRTVVIRLQQPSFLLPYDLSAMKGLEGVVVPKSYIQQRGENEFSSRPVGTGPYKIAEFVPGSHVTFEAAGPHFAEGAPKYQRVKFLEVPEESTRVAMLRRGDVEVIGISADRAQEVQQAGFKIFQLEDSIRVEIKMLQQWKPNSPLADQRVREALNLAINREEIVQTLLKGQGAPARSWMGSWGLGYEQKPAIPHNPARARELLREAGYPNGFALNFYLYPRPRFPEGPLIGQAVVGYWEAIGVRTNVINVDYGVFRPRWAAKELEDPAVAGPHPTTNRLLWDDSAALNYHSSSDLIHTSNPQLDALVDSLVRSSSEQEYVQRIRAVQNYLWDNWLQMAVVTGSQSYGASKAIEKWDLGRHENGVNLRDLLRRR